MAKLRDDQYVPTEEDILFELAQLGNTPDEVAHRLSVRGFVGTPGECDTCPVARYLESTFGRYSRATAAEAEVFHEDAPHGYVAVETPRPVLHFIVKFDEGDYPNLIERHPA